MLSQPQLVSSSRETYTLYYIQAGRSWSRQTSDRKSYLIALAGDELGQWQGCRIKDSHNSIVYAAGQWDLR
jgi:hypothetical protein